MRRPTDGRAEPSQAMHARPFPSRPTPARASLSLGPPKLMMLRGHAPHGLVVSMLMAERERLLGTWKAVHVTTDPYFVGCDVQKSSAALRSLARSCLSVSDKP